MTFYGAVHWWSPQQCLDESFDEPDIEADRELCQAIAAGRWGPHPDAWGNHDPFPLRWLLRRRRELEPSYTPRVDPKEQAEWEAKHRRPEPYTPPVSRKWKDDAKWQAEWEAKHRRPPVVVLPPPPEIFAGEIELTCDDCSRRFWLELAYKSGERSTKAMHLRAMGQREGWTHIGGRDRCPPCSIVAREDIGNGAGERQDDKQHTDGG